MYETIRTQTALTTFTTAISQAALTAGLQKEPVTREAKNKPVCADSLTQKPMGAYAIAPYRTADIDKANGEAQL